MLNDSTNFFILLYKITFTNFSFYKIGSSPNFKYPKISTVLFMEYSIAKFMNENLFTILPLCLMMVQFHYLTIQNDFLKCTITIVE